MDAWFSHPAHGISVFLRRVGDPARQVVRVAAANHEVETAVCVGGYQRGGFREYTVCTQRPSGKCLRMEVVRDWISATPCQRPRQRDSRVPGHRSHPRRRGGQRTASRSRCSSPDCSPSGTSQQPLVRTKPVGAGIPGVAPTTRFDWKVYPHRCRDRIAKPGVLRIAAEIQASPASARLRNSTPGASDILARSFGIVEEGTDDGRGDYPPVGQRGVEDLARPLAAPSHHRERNGTRQARAVAVVAGGDVSLHRHRWTAFGLVDQSRSLGKHRLALTSSGTRARASPMPGQRFAT